MVIIAALMALIFFVILGFFRNIRKHGDSEHFFVCGRYTPGFIGLGISVILSAVSVIFNVSMFYPILLFVICCVLLFFNISPIIRVNGENAVLTTARYVILFSRNDVHIEKGHLFIEDSPMLRGSECVNFDRLMEWLGNEK